MDRTSQVVSADGHRITLTHLDKVLYPETGTTKADVLGYYTEAADALVPLTVDRPATRRRWVHGVGTATEPEPAFFQKNLEPRAPSWLSRRTLRHGDRVIEYPLVSDRATLIWLAHLGSLEFHVPQWRFDPTGRRMNPDRLILDLDPGAGATLADCAEVARLLRVVLIGMDLDPVPVTSGKAGMHLYAALDLRSSSEQVQAVAHELARALEADHPHLVVSTMDKQRRAGKVFIDWSQNAAGKTTIVPYSLRGGLRPTVAAPRTWSELDSPGLRQLEYLEVLNRLHDGLEPAAGLHPQRLTATVRSDSSADSRAAEGTSDRLDRYRGKRDPALTPEPVPGPFPADRPLTASGSAFVIHEHHGRRLHWDLRLEHDGALACWALPKGVPTNPAQNHLAVHTEDHPLEYLTFAGTIPPGRYGAGLMKIWDTGRYELEKWRDDEVLLTLIPNDSNGLGGPCRLALIRTGDDRSPETTWLIHLLKPAAVLAPAPAPEPAPMLATPGSVADLKPETDWAFEMKWDGMRVLAHLSPTVSGSGPRKVRLTTRSGADVSGTFPEIVKALQRMRLGGSTTFDGEIVAVGRTGRPDFARLQTRMHRTVAVGVATHAPQTPVHYLIFDLLRLKDVALYNCRYDDRREILQAIPTPDECVRIPAAFDEDIESALRTSRELGLEGIVAKRHDSTYQPGKRSSSWIKLTWHRTQEVVVGGWRAGSGHRRDTFSSLLLGVPGDAGLDYVGRVGTGFTDRALTEARETLNDLTSETCPFTGIDADQARDAQWVQPALVADIEFSGWTAAGKLRHPSWRGWRPDKSPTDVTRGQPPRSSPARPANLRRNPDAAGAR